MGKPKERPKMVLPSPENVDGAKVLVQKVAHAKARLAKLVSTGDAPAARQRAAKKRVKRSQRRLRDALKYAAQRAKPAAAGGGAATPAS